MPQRVDVRALDELDEEDVVRWDHEGRTFAISRDPDGAVFATDGLCSHERVHLAGGRVMDHVTECPKHNGQFDYRAGGAIRAPVCVDLQTHPARVEGGRIPIQL